MLKVLTAVSTWSDNENPYTCTYVFDVYHAEFDIKAGLQKVLNDFVRTKEGKKVYEEYNERFDIVDIMNNIPDSFFEPYGFKPVKAPIESISLGETFEAVF